MIVSKEEMVDVLKTAAVSRFFFLSRFVSCYWGLQSIPILNIDMQNMDCVFKKSPVGRRRYAPLVAASQALKLSIVQQQSSSKSEHMCDNLFLRHMAGAQQDFSVCTLTSLGQLTTFKPSTVSVSLL